MQNMSWKEIKSYMSKASNKDWTLLPDKHDSIIETYAKSLGNYIIGIHISKSRQYTGRRPGDVTAFSIMYDSGNEFMITSNGDTSVESRSKPPRHMTEKEIKRARKTIRKNLDCRSFKFRQESDNLNAKEVLEESYKTAIFGLYQMKAYLKRNE